MGIDFLDIATAINRTLRDCRDIDAPESLSPAIVFGASKGNRQKLEDDVRGRLQAGTFGFQATQFRIPKGAGTTRILTIPDPVDRVVYQALVAWLGAHASPLEHPDTHSFRPSRSRERVGAWVAFQRSVAELALQHAQVGLTDLADFFETIQHARLEDRILTEFSATDAPRDQLLLVRDTIVALLRRWHPDHRGLPQGAAPSFFLADVFLLRADRAHREAGRRLLRWVDDRYFFATTFQDAQRALREAEQRDREDALLRSSAKTDVILGDMLHEQWQRDQLEYEAYTTFSRRTPAPQRIDYILHRLRDEHDAFSSYVIRFLLTRAAELAYHGHISWKQARNLGELFRATVVRDPQYARHWCAVLGALASSVQVQELVGDLIRSDLVVDDTTVAHLYDILLHGQPECYAQQALSERAAADGSCEALCASRRGKALVTAARADLRDWDQLAHPDEPQVPEMRRYQAVAGQTLDGKHRKAYCRRIGRHSSSATERSFIEFCEHQQKPVWTTPLAKRRNPGEYG